MTFLELEVSMTSKHLMKDIKIKKYIILLPKQESEKKIFDIIFASRCLKLGFEEFIGCKKILKKILKHPIFFLITN